MSAGDPENLSWEELVQKVHALSEENAQLKLELKKEKMANAGASEVKDEQVLCAILIIG